MLFHPTSDVSRVHVTCRIVLLEDPVRPREDSQHVWVYEDQSRVPSTWMAELREHHENSPQIKTLPPPAFAVSKVGHSVEMLKILRRLMMLQKTAPVGDKLWELNRTVNCRRLEAVRQHR
ncbi:hypothetical protein AOLI_G00129350 [Acnodon oligacanthus]